MNVDHGELSLNFDTGASERARDDDANGGYKLEGAVCHEARDSCTTILYWVIYILVLDLFSNRQKVDQLIFYLTFNQVLIINY